MLVETKSLNSSHVFSSLSHRITQCSFNIRRLLQFWHLSSNSWNVTLAYAPLCEQERKGGLKYILPLEFGANRPSIFCIWCCSMSIWLYIFSQYTPHHEFWFYFNRIIGSLSPDVSVDSDPRLRDPVHNKELMDLVELGTVRLKEGLGLTTTMGQTEATARGQHESINERRSSYDNKRSPSFVLCQWMWYDIM